MDIPTSPDQTAHLGFLNITQNNVNKGQLGEWSNPASTPTPAGTDTNHCVSTPRSPFSSVRRVVTGHTSSGKSIFLEDSVQPYVFWDDVSGSVVHHLYRTSEHPAVLDAEVRSEDGCQWVDEIKVNDELVSRDGSTIRSFDMAPGMSVKPHRTWSIDYGIVHKGCVVLELDGGERKVMKEGDVIIQRGTIHAWKNESMEWNRIYFVMLPAKPVEIDGRVLDEVSAK
ncbi:hypothetical protein K474DRAFT_1707489 [Panus rudis PR-1116 ss-1]|nr:hypothetical protein K474DRAFT_1707489 [Panus rudis PR-1116 ss-1]